MARMHWWQRLMTLRGNPPVTRWMATRAGSVNRSRVWGVELDFSSRNRIIMWVIAEAERPQVMAKADPVREVGVFADDGLELGLGEDDDLQQLVFVRLVVQELPQDSRQNAGIF